jgi:phosphoglycolate phosphatase-like HAD superfamily hydrolase
VTPHVVWDWNGTLLDDIAISVEAASAACQLVGGGPVVPAEYRRCFTRPVRSLYDGLLGRPVTDDQWHLIAETYHEQYNRRLPAARLRPETAAVLAGLAGRGATQSLLSMGEHEDLVALIGRAGLTGCFLLVEGARRQDRTSSKQVALERHLAAVRRLRVEPLHADQVLLVGDTVDDGVAALAVGAACVLLADGSSLREAVNRLATRAAGRLAVTPCLATAVETGLRLLPVDDRGAGAAAGAVTGAPRATATAAARGGAAAR